MRARYANRDSRRSLASRSTTPRNSWNSRSPRRPRLVEIAAWRGACLALCCSYGCHVGGDVLHPDLLETGRFEQRLFETVRLKDKRPIDPLRAAISSRRIIPVGDRIGKSRRHLNAGRDATPRALADARTLIDRVDAEQRVKAAVIEWQRFARVPLHEARAIGEPLLRSRCVRRDDGRIMEVDAGHAAARFTNHEQRRTARSARHLQHIARRAEFERGEEPAVLIGRQPRVLTDLLAERLGADR